MKFAIAFLFLGFACLGSSTSMFQRRMDTQAHKGYGYDKNEPESSYSMDNNNPSMYAKDMTYDDSAMNGNQYDYQKGDSMPAYSDSGAGNMKGYQRSDREANSYDSTLYQENPSSFEDSQAKSELDALSLYGNPGEDFPIFSEAPKTGFACKDQQFPGYYADDEARCQVYHICQDDGRQDAFLCPNATLFNQKYFICDWWFNVDCSAAQQYYGLNADLYKTEEDSAYNNQNEYNSQNANADMEYSSLKGEKGLSNAGMDSYMMQKDDNMMYNSKGGNQMDQQYIAGNEYGSMAGDSRQQKGYNNGQIQSSKGDNQMNQKYMSNDYSNMAGDSRQQRGYNKGQTQSFVPMNGY